MTFGEISRKALNEQAEVTGDATASTGGEVCRVPEVCVGGGGGGGQDGCSQTNNRLNLTSGVCCIQYVPR